MVGLFGGTFNPIHYGHLLLCEGIREEFELDKIIFIPAKIPPHKDSNKIIQADYRLAMVKLAIDGNPNFEVSDIELKREGSSYTVDTLKLYSDKIESKNIGLILGADSIIQFETWRSYTEIFNLANIFVAMRPGINFYEVEDAINRYRDRFGARIYTYNQRQMDYSSTEIRRRVKAELSIKYQVTPAVEEFIRSNNLYIEDGNGEYYGHEGHHKKT